MHLSSGACLNQFFGIISKPRRMKVKIAEAIRTGQPLPGTSRDAIEPASTEEQTTQILVPIRVVASNLDGFCNKWSINAARLSPDSARCLMRGRMIDTRPVKAAGGVGGHRAFSLAGGA